MGLYENLLKLVNPKKSELKLSNSIKIYYGTKNINNVLSDKGDIFNSKIKISYINTLVPLITSLMCVKYKLYKKYKLYGLNNVISVNICDNKENINVTNEKCIDYDINNKCVVMLNNEENKALIDFECSKIYYNVENYLSYEWMINNDKNNGCNNCKIICDVFTSYIMLRMEVNELNNVNKIEKNKNAINIFEKILSQLDLS